jgi:hypothetical protein
MVVQPDHKAAHTTNLVIQLHTQPTGPFSSTHNQLDYSAAHTTNLTIQLHTRPTWLFSCTYNQPDHSAAHTTNWTIKLHTNQFDHLFAHNQPGQSSSHLHANQPGHQSTNPV